MQPGFAMPTREISTDSTGNFVDWEPCTAELSIGKSLGSEILYGQGETASPEGPRLNGEQFTLPTYWRTLNIKMSTDRDSEDTEQCLQSRCSEKRSSSE